MIGNQSSREHAARLALRGGYRVVAGYVVVGILWILLSDRALQVLVHDPGQLITVSVYKGWAFVGMTGFLLWYLVNRLIHQIFTREEKLHILVQSLPDLIWVKNTEGAYVSCNQAFLDALGMTEEQIIGKKGTEVLTKEQHLRVALLDEQIVATGQPMHWVEEAELPDGKLVTLAISKTPMRDAQGQIIGVLGLSRDITDQKRVEDALRESEAQFRDVVESSPNGILIIDELGSITMVNRQMESLFGYGRAELIGQSVEMIIPEVLHPKHGANLMSFGDDPMPRPMSLGPELHGKRNDGGEIPVEVGLTPIKTANGVFVLATVQDVSERRQNEERIRRLALFDDLTALPNRNLFTQCLNQALGEASGSDRVTLFVIDLDRFKHINESLGHHHGDYVLREISSRLRSALREKDFVARIGGDEFVVMATNTTDLTALAQKIGKIIAEPMMIGASEHSIGSSIGISSFPHDSHDPGDLQRYADLALNSAKEKGRQGFEFYSEILESRSSRRLTLETALRGALERNEFTLHYQPILTLDSEPRRAAEALIRWNHPELGLVPPDQFIPIAEETGLIISIGAWVLRQACLTAGTWSEPDAPMYISVNLSARQFRDEGLIRLVSDCLVESGLEPEQLQLEITESMMVDSPEESIILLQALKSIGIRIAIDDFGTGYSSLAYLKRFPIDCIKVDRSFVRDIPADGDSVAITQAIIALAKTLNLGVVAEGVETGEQVAFLDELGCHKLQGYYFSRPLPEGDFAKLLSKSWDPTRWLAEDLKAA